jgi:uncharacterized phage-associated protein
MNKATKIALIVGGVILIGGAIGGFVWWNRRKKDQQEKERLESIKKAEEEYIPERLGTVSAQEAGWTLTQNRPTELAGVKK